MTVWMVIFLKLVSPSVWHVSAGLFTVQFLLGCSNMLQNLPAMSTSGSQAAFGVLTVRLCVMSESGHAPSNQVICFTFAVRKYHTVICEDYMKIQMKNPIAVNLQAFNVEVQTRSCFAEKLWSLVCVSGDMGENIFYFLGILLCVICPAALASFFLHRPV